MKRTNALKLRQSLGSLLRSLEKGGEPIIIERRSKPSAVLISIEDFQKRFVDRNADEKRKEIINRIRGAKLRLPDGLTSLELLQQGRR